MRNFNLIYLYLDIRLKLLAIIIGHFFLSDPQITKQDKDWLYPQMIQAIKKVVANSIILVFSPTRLSNLMNYRTYYFLCLEYLVFVEQLYLTNLSYSFWQRW